MNYEDEDYLDMFGGDDEEGEVYKVGFKDLERTSAYDPELDYNIKDRNTMRNLSDEIKFKIFTKIIFEKLKGPLKLGEQDLEILYEKRLQTKDIKYKNTGAFILGYYCIRDKKIDKEAFNKAKTIGMPILKEYTKISAEDILKYARYWTLYLV